MEEIIASEQAMRDARAIGDKVRERHNIQPAAAPELDKDGFMRVAYVPPPSYGDISLKDLGKQTLMY